MCWPSQGTLENIFTRRKNVTCTLHVQSAMASAIEDVHRRACCVRGSVHVDFCTKTCTGLFTWSMLLLVTADRDLDFTIGLCYSSGMYGGGERLVGSGSLSCAIAVEGTEVESTPSDRVVCLVL